MKNHDPSKCPNCLSQQVAQSAMMFEIGKHLEKDFVQFSAGRKTKKRKEELHARNQFLWEALDFWLEEYSQVIAHDDDSDQDHGGGSDDGPEDDDPEGPDDPGEEVTLTKHQEEVADHHLDFLKVRITNDQR